MTNNNSEHIDLFDVFATIWNGKFRIILITLTSFMIAFVYDYQKPNSYEVSIDLKESKPGEFIKFLTINKFITDLEKQKTLDPKVTQVNLQTKYDEKTMFNSFLDEFLDYEELISVLENQETISKQISRLDENEKDNQLYKHAKRFKIEQIIEKNKLDDQKDRITLTFIWHDKDEALEILDKTFKIVLSNLKVAVFTEIDEFLSIKNFIDKNNDLSRIDRLLEESEIAKELNIADSRMESVNLSKSDVSFNINTVGSAYYLRGYKAIDKEITLIKNRKYAETTTLKNKLEEIKNTNIKLIDYNLYLTNIVELKDSEKIWSFSIFIGLIIGIFYTLILNSVQNYKANKQR